MVIRQQRPVLFVLLLAALGACGVVRGAPAPASGPSTGELLVSPSPSWPLDRIDQRSLPLDGVFRRRGSGRGVTVYVFGGGISTKYTELPLDRLRQGFSAFPGDRSVCDGQTTAAGGAIAGSHFGVAPQATVVDVKIVNCLSGQMTGGAVTNATRWVIADHVERGGSAVVAWPFIPDTVGLALPLREAQAALAKVGVAVVTGAGGDDGGCGFGSTERESTLAVAPTDTTFLTAQTAPRVTADQCTDLVAPGVYPDAVWGDGHPDSPTVIWRGTSIAVGYATGAAAVLLEGRPTTGAKRLIGQLIGTATPDSIVGAPPRHVRLLYIGTNR